MVTDEGRAAQTSLYERVGGDGYFHSLVDRFYEGVEADPVLRPLYPEDLAPARFHLAEFLVQYWGGPRRYSERRGPPPLRMRPPLPLGVAGREARFPHPSRAVAAPGRPPGEGPAAHARFPNAAHTPPHPP